MQATQSSTASASNSDSRSTAQGMYSRSGPFTLANPGLSSPSVFSSGVPTSRFDIDRRRPARLFAQPLPDGRAVSEREGLTHDARSLLGALGLYCDLLAMPNVLREQHRHYADELRLIGTRSLALIERMNRPANPATPAPCRAPESAHLKPPAVSLSEIVGQSSGLLQQVSGGHPIAVSYGGAASAPVRIGREAFERILLNLVRNAAAAMPARTPAARGHAVRSQTVSGQTARNQAVRSQAARNQGSASRSSAALSPIRIEVGFLGRREDDHAPWPLQRVRLTVADSGCGMSADHLERVLGRLDQPVGGGRGIGLRIVRELLAESGGSLTIASQPGAGTTVQIEWPVELSGGLSDSGRGYGLDPVQAHPEADPELIPNAAPPARNGSAQGVSC